MHKLPRDKLCELIKREGKNLTNDFKRCEGLLQDACASSNKYRREIFVIVNALKQGVAQKLLNPPPGSQDTLFTRLVNQLHANLALEKDAAEWAVQTWVNALEVDITIPIKKPSNAATQSPKDEILAKKLLSMKYILASVIAVTTIAGLGIGYVISSRQSGLSPPPQPQSAEEIKAEKQRLAQLQKEAAAAKEKYLAQTQKTESDVQLQIDEKTKQLAELEKAAKDEEQRLKQLEKVTEEQERQLNELANSSKRIFRDRLKIGGVGPEMIIIPAGRFQMGDIQGDGDFDERPVHWVEIKPFAMGRYEVTFAEYDRFAEATGRTKPNDQNWGRDNRPVINVSWNDAKNYATWLTKQTGRQYRLPTEAEWEYAARAGTKTHYWWGKKISANRLNIRDSGSRWSGKQTAPVGSFYPNPFGLYDMLGNVWEWCADHWHDNYHGAPSDGGEWKTGGDVLYRVLRGGSWADNSKRSRVSHREKDTLNTTSYLNGFRVVTITPEWTDES